MAFPLLFAQLFVSLASITASHDAFGYQSSMKNVAIRLLSEFSLLRNRVTLRSGIYKSDISPYLDIAERGAKLPSWKHIHMMTALGRFLDGK